MILHIEDPKDGTRKQLELFSEFNNVAGYKLSIQKSVAFLHTKNERPKREIQEAIPFTITPERIKYLGTNLPKETKDLYSENCKMLRKEIKEEHKQKDILCSWIIRINTVKMTIPFKAIFRFNQSLSNYQ